MSDIPPEHIKMEPGKCDNDNDIEPESLFWATSSIWMNESIIKTLGQFGSQAELQVLRQINEKYFEILNSTYWDSVDKGLAFKFCSWDESNYETGARIFEAAQPVQEVKNSEMEDEECENLTDTLKKLTPDKAHIFRKLDLKCVWIDKLDNTCDGLRLKAVIAQLAPYITTLILNELPFGSENPGEKFAEFVNTFTNLKNLEIHDEFHDTDLFFDMDWYDVNFDSEDSMSLDQLEIGLESLKINPKITLFIPHERGVLTKFATKQMAIKVLFLLEELDDFELFRNACTQFGHLKNINYRIHATFFILINLAQLETLTQLCIQLDGKIQELTLGVDTGFESQFQEQDQFGIRNCLTQLSHQITMLHIDLSKEKNWDILNPDSEWPKLKDLSISGYKYPLEILKKCSNLEILYLNSDQDSCFFNDKQQSDAQNLEEYFGNFPKLTRLTLTQVRYKDKIAEGNELDRHLKQILPHLGYLNYWNYPGDLHT